MPSELQISEEEYADWRGQINRISLSAEILHYITNVRRQLKRLLLDDEMALPETYI